MSANRKAQLKTLLDAKEYRAAIALLEKSNAPGAKDAIAKLRAKIEAEKPKRRFDPTGVMIIAVILMVLIAGGVAIVISNANRDAELTRNAEVSNDLWGACIEKYSGLDYRQKYDLQVIVDGCYDAVEFIMKDYRPVADECTAKYPDDKSVMATCIDLRSPGFTEDWIEQAAKE